MEGEGGRLEFWLLGPFEVTLGGERLNVGGPQLRTVLARLLVDAGRTVSLAALIDELWGEHAPVDASRTARTYVSRLRKTLPNGELVMSPPGYRLTVDRDTVDAVRFERLATSGRQALEAGQPGLAHERLTAALALWRGDALAEFAELSALGDAAVRLDRMRLDVIEERIEAALAMGLDAELAGELEDMVRAHPLRERLWGQLMVALYRSGRQAEALAAYRQARDILVDEYAVEPSPRLAEIHQQILRQDSGLSPNPPAQARSALPVPAQLPPRVMDFTGRTAELEYLDSLLAACSTAVVISTVSGTAGVGKTALAVYWAHRVADRFPDGQLYLNLRGFDPTGHVLDPADALRRLLDSLDVPADRIPDDLDARTALYRSRLAGKRVLVVLDNARDSAQVRPLLPGSPNCLVLVTSRAQLTGLVANDGAHPVNLDLLTHDEARHLLARRLGADRLMAEPDEVDEIVDRCARLPIALTILAARAATQPHRPLSDLAAELRDSRDRFDTLTTDDPTKDVRAVFSWSYRQLGPAASRMFRLLGLHPGPDIGAPAVASLGGVPVDEARALLAELVSASLIAEHASARFSFHDLLHAYALDLTSTVDSEDVRTGARDRMYNHYLHSAYAADRMMDLHRDPIDVAEVRAGVTPEEFADADTAMSWFTTEQMVLRGILSQAAASGLDEHTLQIPWTLMGFYELRGHRTDRDAALRIALEAAVRLADRATEARAHRGFAVAYVRQGRFEDMDHHLRQALRIYRELDDRRGLAHVHSLAGGSLALRGQAREALAEFERCLSHHRALGDSVNEANALNAIGWCHTTLGEHEEAIVHCERAVVLLERLGNVIDLAATIDTIGYARLSLGQHEEAASCFDKARKLFHDVGDRYQTAAVGVHIGDNELAMGHVAAARDAWRAALTTLDELEHPDAEAVRAKLDEHHPAST